MRKILYYLLGLVLIAAAVAAGIGAARNSKSHNDKTSNTTTATTKPAPAAKKACDIFTLADAKQLLGDTAKGGQSTTDASSQDLTVTTCTYTQSSAGSSLPVGSTNSASLLVRAPKSQKGITGNANEFGQLRPRSVQDVSGYGDGAYWDIEHGQLNILKNNNWYILSYGPVTPADRTLDQTRQLADILITKL
jgi:hypothetical protein